MKKLFGIILSVLLCGILFTSFSPSLDGRAVVAEEGVMPKGVFAKTVGYLPGDSISVTSLITKKSVDILVIGSIDSSEGIAILLSPEAAELLGLSKDLNNVVKITKRSGQLDEAVAGTAVIGGVVEGAATEYNEDSAVDVEPEENSEEENNAPAEEIESTEENTENQEAENAEENSESVEEIAEVPEEKKEEKEPEVIEATEEEQPEETSEEPETVQEIEEPPVESESVEAEPLEEIDATEVPELSEEKAEEQPIEDDVSELEEEPVESDKVEDEPEVIEATEEEPLNSEIAPVPVESEEVSTEEIPESDEFAGERVEDEDLSELPAETVPQEESVEDNVEEVPSENTEVPVQEEIPSEVPFDEESVAADELSELPSETPFVEPENNVVSNEESSDESFEPIVLVPTESNPPEASKVEKTEEKPTENENIVPKTVLTESNKSSLDKYKVNSLKELQSGKYYVQIAVLADEKNIQDVISKYAEQYPVVLVPLASGKATQVMIGPLNMDEYGTVLNRFKKSGYKDAFLRKVR